MRVLFRRIIELAREFYTIVFVEREERDYD